MSLQDAYDNYRRACRSGALSDHNEKDCGCRDGWFLSPVDTWHECPLHSGRPHPEAREEDDLDDD